MSSSRETYELCVEVSMKCASKAFHVASVSEVWQFLTLSALAGPVEGC
jgi:hypothetical protein